MSITGVTTQSLIASLGYLDPTQDQTQDVSDASSLGSIGSLANSNLYSSGGSGASATDISQVGYILSSLSKLEKKDPDGFKTQAGEIAGDFNAAADQCTDPLQRYALKSMAEQFSNASLTGSMSSINIGNAANTLVKSYTQQSSLTLLDYLNGSQGTDMAGQMSSILSANLSSKLTGIGA